MFAVAVPRRQTVLNSHPLARKLLSAESLADTPDIKQCGEGAAQHISSLRASLGAATGLAAPSLTTFARAIAPPLKSAPARHSYRCPEDAGSVVTPPSERPTSAATAALQPLYSRSTAPLALSRASCAAHSSPALEPDERVCLTRGQWELAPRREAGKCYGRAARSAC